MPGPDEEVQLVRNIFRMAIRSGTTSIVRYLNEQRIKAPNGPRWTYSKVKNLLTNPKYVGMNVWGRTSFKLQGRRLRIGSDQWVVQPGAFSPLVDQNTFDRVQKALHERAQRCTDEELLSDLKRLLRTKGKLTQRLIFSHTGHSNATYFHRFGNLRRVYDLIGYRPSQTAFIKSDHRTLTLRVREKFLREVEALLPDHLTIFRLAGKTRTAIRVDNEFTVTLVICRYYRTPNTGAARWELVPPNRERHLVTLLCLQNANRNGFQSMYLLPGLDKQKEYQIKSEDDPWLRRGVRLTSLRQFYRVAKTVAGANAALDKCRRS